MKRFSQFLLLFAAGLIVFLFTLGKIGQEHLETATSLLLSPSGLLITLFALLFGIVGILQWKYILKTMGANYTFKQLAPLWLFGHSISYITPFAVFGGEFFRAYFAKKKLPDLDWKKSIASVAIDKIIYSTSFFAFLIIGLGVFTFYGRLPTSFLGIGALSTAGLFLVLLAIFYFKRLKKESIVEWFLKSFGKKNRLQANGQKLTMLEIEQEVFKFFSLKSKRFWKTVSFSILRGIINVARCLLLIFFLTSQMDILKAMAGYSFAALAFLSPFPATLGALEIGEGIAFAALGLTFNMGAVFGIVWRAGDIVLALIGLVFAVKYSSLFIEAKIFKMFSSKK